mmetsp:Transcript_29366/g.44328  ORF Transcript_29366/g.44328 Transcript_29366/m.44328 type:complete len:167 (+) Transcript_29366:3869-4369(+)
MFKQKSAFHQFHFPKQLGQAKTNMTFKEKKVDANRIDYGKFNRRLPENIEMAMRKAPHLNASSSMAPMRRNMPGIRNNSVFVSLGSMDLNKPMVETRNEVIPENPDEDPDKQIDTESILLHHPANNTATAQQQQPGHSPHLRALAGDTNLDINQINSGLITAQSDL